MAKQPSAFGGSRALGYQESFFGNRNDMLQSALDSVLLSYQDEMTKYEAAVELYKDATGIVDKERARLLKLRDDLQKEQIKGAQAARQFNAGQLNSSARSGASIQAANDRFNAKQAAIASYLGSQAFKAGARGADDVLANEARQAYTSSPGDISASMSALGRQYVQTTEVPKTAVERDIGRAYLFQQHLGDEVRQDKYSFLDPQDQMVAAADNLLSTLSAEDRASVERGLLAQQERVAGRGAAIAAQGGQVTSGGIPTTTVGEPDYSALIADVEARLGRVQEAQVAAAPRAPEAPDLLKLQRDEYFRSFFPGYTPAYQINEAAAALSKLPSEDAMALLELYRAEKSAERLAGRMPAETPLGGEVVDGRPRYAAGKEGPRMAGDVLGGKGSPFIPVEGPIGSVESKMFDAYADMARRELVGGGVAAPVQDVVPEARLKALDLSGTPYSVKEEEARKVAQDAKKLLDEAKTRGVDEKTIAMLQNSYDKALKTYSDIFATGQEPALVEAMREEKRTYPFPTPKQADRKEVKRLLPDQADLQAKLKAAKEVEKIVDTPEFDKLLGTDVGKATKDIYEANKAKGDESGKEIMKYVAREFPRSKDQNIAAQVVMGLSYKDSNAGKMGQEDFELGGGVVSPEE